MKKKILIFLFILISTISYAPNLSKKKRVERNSYYLAVLREKDIDERIKDIKNLEFSGTLLVEYFNLVAPELPDIPLRQFILETGWFTSESFTDYNNLAGMKLAVTRTTTATGEELHHATYDHWTCSVDDYVYWVKYWKSKGYDTSDYYSFLDEIGYATFKYYTQRLKNINLKRLRVI